MSEQDEIKTLDGLLEGISNAEKDSDRISIEQVHTAIGRRAFGPALLIPGLIALSPLSGMPGVPTLVGVMVLLIAGQLLIGRDEFWLPGFLLRRSISRKRFQAAMKAMRPVARFTDRLIKPRLSFLVQGPAAYVIAALCLLFAFISPLLEMLPLAITGVGGVLTAFGLALVADDGALGLIALLLCLGMAIAIGVALL